MIEISFHYGWIQSFAAFAAGACFIAAIWAEEERARTFASFTGFAGMMLLVVAAIAPVFGR